MAKKIASPKQTAGEGFSFEDKVVAYFLLHLINGLAPFESRYGVIEEIILQTRAINWLLDDMQIITKSPSNLYRFTFSIKSNKQITRKGFPLEFVSTCWEQINDKQLPFDKSTDFGGLITSPLAESVKTQLDELLRWSKEQKKSNFIKALTSASKIKQDIFKSVDCPLQIKSKFSIRNPDSFMILKSILHMDFDFLLNNSSKESKSIQLCRDALDSSDINEASLLWKSLTSLANTYRVNKSNVTREKIILDLNQAFQLKEYPNYRPDYEKLRTISSYNLKDINDVIGGEFHLDREKDLSELSHAIENSPFVVTLGRSGSGKSALLKKWVETNTAHSSICWIKATSFEKKEFVEFENLFRLNYSLEKLFHNISNVGYVVIDGVDNLLTENALNNFILFLKLLPLSEKRNLWKVILTCQSEDWNRVYDKIKIGLPFIEVKTCELLESEAEKLVDHLLQKNKNLYLLKRNKPIKQLLLNLKILDLIISKSKSLSSSEVSKWVGESDVLDWFWNNVIAIGDKAILRGNILKKLARFQGDLLINEISVTKFEASELVEIKLLEKEKLCSIKFEKISFYHDLLGDWVRTKDLIGESENIKEFLSTRVTSSLWLRAIRYYGIYILEQKSIDEWRNLLIEFESQDLKIISNNLLEAILFSKSTIFILEDVHRQLLEKDSSLLRRLLTTFLHVCTFANPIYQNYDGSDKTLKTIYSTLDRIPNVLYWIPILLYIKNHLTEIIGLIPDLIAEITLKWLKYTPNDYPLREEVAEIAVILAEKEFAYHNSKIIYMDKANVTKKAYTAAMYAINELPERVKALALTYSSRIEIDDSINKQIEVINKEIKKLDEAVSIQKQLFLPPSLSNIIRGKIPPPWPLGPQKSVDSDFQEACLEADALYPIIDNNPELAKEILLALLIKEPTSQVISHHAIIFNHFEIEDDSKFYPPMYFKGPFLYFLRRSPEIAIDTIIQLVNFATDRWKDTLNKNYKYKASLSINIAGEEVCFNGDAQVFYWFRGNGNAPNPIVSALMALEKYLYDLIDSKKEIEKHIIQINGSSRSLAFCGLLISIGLKTPSLFLKSLKSLMLVAEFHFWELSFSIQPKGLLMSGWELESKESYKIAYEWHSLKHREYNLCSLSEYLVKNHKIFDNIFTELRRKWEKIISDLPSESPFRSFLENRIELYNKKNYEVITSGGESYWQYNEPTYLTVENDEKRREGEEYKLLLNFPITCRRILLNEYTIDESKVEAFIATVKKIDSIIKNDDPFVSRENALSGGIAVLFSKFPNILLKDIELEKWSTNKILDIVFNPPKDFDLTSEVDINDMRWDSFCAEVLPILWEKNINSQKIKEAVCIIATMPYYKTVEILFNSAYKNRVNLGFNWNKLQNFILLFSAIRANISRFGNEYNDFIYMRDELCKEFIKDNIKTNFISLGSIYESLPPKLYKKLNSINVRFGDVDLLLIKAAFNWMFLEKVPKESDERSIWIMTWSDFFHYTLEKISNKEPRREDDYGLPDIWDRWVFDYLPELIIKLEDINQGEQFWKPIIELGIPYHHYIKDFFRGWFLYYFRSVELNKEAEIKKNFIEVWKHIIDHALLVDSWKPNFERRWYRIEDMAIALICIESVDFNLWEEELVNLVDGMGGYYKKWVDSYFAYSSCAVSFINFLRQPAAKHIVVEAICWIRDGLDESKNHWAEKEITESLSYLLNVVYTKHLQLVRKNNKSFEAFKYLMHKLVERQNKIALEIQSQILSLN